MKTIVLALALALANLPAAAQSLDTKPDPTAETRRVDHFVVEGSNLLPKEKLDEVLRVYEGKDLTLAQMKEAAADITSLYQRSGYYLVRAIIPQQQFDTGNVRMQVVEGKIGEIKVEGAEYYDPDFIRERFQVAVQDQNFKADDFTRAMALLNELSDLEVKAVLAPGKDPTFCKLTHGSDGHAPGR